MADPRPKHGVGATNEAETWWRRLQSSMVRTGVAFEVKSDRTKKVRGLGLPCGKDHSLTHFRGFRWMKLERAQRPFEKSNQK